jgi:hypothetical protein
MCNKIHGIISDFFTGTCPFNQQNFADKVQQLSQYRPTEAQLRCDSDRIMGKESKSVIRNEKQNELTPGRIL